VSKAVLPFIVLVAAAPVAAADLSSREKLGEALFFDVNLSSNRTQACASCHDPAFGFSDPRDNGAEKGGRMASLGANGASVGDRNAPTASYAAFSPTFSFNTKTKVAKGGQFHDGRAATLQDQAAGPPLNPGEMAMASKADVLGRLKEKPEYVAAFAQLYGAAALENAERAYDAMTDAIASFERTPFFAPFDSKYDRALRGAYKMTPEEELGQTLFFSRQFTNCNICHQLAPSPAAEKETFSNYEYHNIGVPANAGLRAVNGVKPRFVDRGLAENPTIKDKKATEGKFKTPTLRNVAVTGPYMHNGVFADLETVIRFYNKYNATSDASRLNPETGKPWGKPEVAKNLSMKELETGPALDDRRIKALVAFLKTLTDARYEHLVR
jgi:cytochrome c peroxidase